jgi:hypothetical protein
MTGSALNIYNGGAPVTRQIELAQGRVRRRRAVLRQLLGAAGRGHRRRRRGARQSARPRVRVRAPHPAQTIPAANIRSVRRQAAVFEAPTIHRDEIAALPSGRGAGGNDFGVQAAAFFMAAAHSGACSTTRSTTMSILRRPPSATARRWSTKACSATPRRSAPSPPSCAPCRRTRTMHRCCGSTDLGPAMRSEALRLARDPQLAASRLPRSGESRPQTSDVARGHGAQQAKRTPMIVLVGGRCQQGDRTGGVIGSARK